jgi:uncharacterized protein
VAGASVQTVQARGYLAESSLRILATAMAVALAANPAQAGEDTARPVAWWIWPLALLLLTFLLAVVTVVAGLGGGTVFVPIVSGFFPFHLDFVRAAGLLVALAGALAAGPDLLEKRLADFRLALPVALVTSASAVVGAIIGLALPGRVVQTALGVVVLLVLIVTLAATHADFPEVPGPDRLARALRIAGAYQEQTVGREVSWTVHRTWQGLTVFAAIGLIAGAFGIGAGWANVAALNLVMGVPLKVAVGTSVFLLSITDTAAAWVYLNEGAVLPMVVVPSLIGVMLGARVGVRILAVAKPKAIRWAIAGLLLFAGVRALLKGLGIWP